MIASGNQRHLALWWQVVLKRWNRTPGYLKWAGGLLLGAFVRLAFERFFPERWDRLSHSVLDPTMPIWLAVVGVILILALERTLPSLYHRARLRGEQMPLRSLFGVRWALPPDVERVQGPYCTACKTLLRGTLWSGDCSPTLWVCPTCGREFDTPEFPDIREEAERHLLGTR